MKIENDAAPAGDNQENAEGDSEEKKKKKKRNRNKGKGKVQTDPPSIPISELFGDGKSFIYDFFLFEQILSRMNLFI